jgi:hypothetical protein
MRCSAAYAEWLRGTARRAYCGPTIVPIRQSTRFPAGCLQERVRHVVRALKARLGRLRSKRPTAAQDEFVLAAIAQNRRRLAKLITHVPQPPSSCCPDLGVSRSQINGGLTIAIDLRTSRWIEIGDPC